MSVEYSSKVMYGYKLNAEETTLIDNYLTESGNDEYIDEYLHYLNSWGDGSEGAIFGIEVMRTEEGCADLISSLNPTSPEATNMSWAWSYNTKCEQLVPNAKKGMYLCCFIY